MTGELDKGVIHDAQAVADFLTRQGITVVGVEGEDGVDTYVFMPASNSPDLPFQIGELSYDRAAGEVLPIPPEVEERRKSLPGFVDAINSFGRLLDRAKGDFYADVFAPVHNALSLIDFPPNSSRNR